MTTPTPETIAAWTTLITVARHLLEDAEEALKAEKLPPLSWYDALLEIEKAGPQGIRPYALKDKLLLPQYGTSRLLDRLEKAGLIYRESCENDGRGQSVALSEEGFAMRKRMWPVYARFLEKSLEKRMSPTELKDLAAMLNRLRK